MSNWPRAKRNWKLFLSSLFLKWSLDVIPESDLTVEIATLYHGLSIEFLKMKT